VSQLDIKALEANFEGWRAERAPELTISEAFERFAIEQVLKDADLEDDEIQSGNFGGEDDGGVDAMYFFINNALIQDETEVPEQAMSAELAIIQAKYELGFKEDTIGKFAQFTRDLLDYSRAPEDIPYLNVLAREGIARFRSAYAKILGSLPTLHITYHYVTKADGEPNGKVVARAAEINKFVKQTISSSVTNFQYWNCNRLLAAARTTPTKTFTLELTNKFSTDDGAAVVCLTSLRSFVAFLTDDHGDLRRSILEPNVRDYQGKSNRVNKDIRATLGSGTEEEFWWLNNGVTILATKHSLSGNKLTIERPEIVNGLQTSQEIFAYFKEHEGKQDSRNLLVRVIAPPDDQTRTRITKATNNQTPVPAVSLHASDDIHFDIEERFKLYNLYYDRRKGKYRNMRKPISQIVSIPALAKTVMAIVLQKPDDARARLQTFLGKEENYSEVFNQEYDRELYVACALLDRQVADYLSAHQDIVLAIKRDIRYYVDMVLAARLAGAAAPSAKQIADLHQTLTKPTDAQLLAVAVKQASNAYTALGGTDKVAKGPDLRNMLAAELAAIYPKAQATLK